MKPGDVVRLRSGGPLLTVSGVGQLVSVVSWSGESKKPVWMDDVPEECFVTAAELSSGDAVHTAAALRLCAVALDDAADAMVRDRTELVSDEIWRDRLVTISDLRQRASAQRQMADEIDPEIDPVTA